MKVSLLGKMLVPLPSAEALMPNGLEMPGAVPPVEVEVEEVPVPLLSGGVVPEGPQGFGKGSLFSVLEGCTPELSKLPPKAEKGLFPN